MLHLQVVLVYIATTTRQVIHTQSHRCGFKQPCGQKTHFIWITLWNTAQRERVNYYYTYISIYYHIALKGVQRIVKISLARKKSDIPRYNRQNGTLYIYIYIYIIYPLTVYIRIEHVQLHLYTVNQAACSQLVCWDIRHLSKLVVNILKIQEIKEVEQDCCGC